MSLYLLLLEAEQFHGFLRPALTAAWRTRDFAPCKPLAIHTLPRCQEFAERYHLGSDQPVLAEVAAGVAFDRQRWRRLVSEMLWYNAREIPQWECPPDTLLWLLARERFPHGSGERSTWSPIEQAHFGSHDLRFGGGFYRPEHCGWNDQTDVARLAAFLSELKPDRWTPVDLEGLTGMEVEGERAEELAYVKERLPEFQGIYERAQNYGQVIVCEQI